MPGHFLTIWTIRLALVFYVAYLAGWLTLRAPSWPKFARWLWTAGCAAFVLHVLAAFHFTHHWSNRSAVAETARRTQEMLGVAFGEGIYFSYLFLLVWVADVAAWWRLGERYLQRPRWLAALVHGYLGFIAFNGAVVFEGGATRWGGLAACVGLAALLVVRWTRAAQRLPRGTSVREGSLADVRELAP